MTTSFTTPRVALITGAGSGIGRAIAIRLAAMGYSLMLSGRTEATLIETKNIIQSREPTIKTVYCVMDVRDAIQCDTLVSETLTQFGQIDVLVNNAGIASTIGLIQEIPAEQVHAMIDTNLKGAIFMMQSVLNRCMVAQGAGTIVNINSVAGQTAFPFWSVYDASKFGLRAVTEAVAEEQRQNGIKVVGLYPGATDTPIWSSLDRASTAEPMNTEGMLSPERIADAVAYILQQPQGVFVSELTLAPIKPVL